MKKQVKKNVSHETSVAKTEERRKVVFAGAQSLLTRPKSKQEEQNRQLLILTSKALAINPFGVNILGNLPYTNNIGRKEKLAQYEKTARFEYRWVRRSETDLDKAICECRIVKGDKPLCDWVTGECSPATIKMGPLQGYQNHMAQTRAENRAFEAAYGNKLRLELFGNIQRLMSGGVASEDQAARALNAGKTSYEEAVEMRPSNDHAAPIAPAEKKTEITESDMTKIRAIIKSTGSIDALIQIDNKVQGSKLYTKAQKDEIKKLTSDRGHELDV